MHWSVVVRPGYGTLSIVVLCCRWRWTIGMELIVIFILYFFYSLFLYEIGTTAECSRYESAPDMKLYSFIVLLLF